MSRAPNFAAASACIPGITCAYTPRVVGPDGFRATVQRTASLTAVHRKVDAQVASAQASVASAVAAIEGGDVSDRAIQALTDARAALAAALDVQTLLSACTLDTAECQPVLAAAGSAMGGGPVLPIALDYDAELAGGAVSFRPMGSRIRRSRTMGPGLFRRPWQMPRSR